MNLEDMLLDRVIDLHHSIQTPEQARDHLDAMTNSEFLTLLSTTMDQLEDIKPFAQA